MTLPEPFPLAWPDGWPRTRSADRRPSRFDDRHSYALTSLKDELRLLGSIEHVVTSNLPTRRDGQPYASGRQVDDPGIAVYWRQPDDSGRMVTRTMACDRWILTGSNIRAIALSVGALRGLERWGSSTIVDRAFAGFAALPPAGHDWRSMFPGCHTLDEVKLAFRRAAADVHPDVTGGNDAEMQRLNIAYAAAKSELAR